MPSGRQGTVARNTVEQHQESECPSDFQIIDLAVNHPEANDEEYRGETRTVTVHRSAEKRRKETKHIFVRRRVEDMPVEPRRENIVTPGIVLAFPMKSNGSLILEQQYVFAFLPINEYCFRFLIQGDFILTASRESLALTAWNEKLQEAIPSAFEVAVHRFNNIKGGLGYAWPQYLELLATGIAFGKDLGDKLVKHLGSCLILQIRAGSFQKPQDLVFIPPEFCFDGEPMINFKRLQGEQLAFEYAPNGTLLSSLKSLGVKVMDDEMFFEQFHS
ncbi:hypothetical protein LZ31DRAFT_628187 [Colletotrichum somersetense]|nr:hypothetical protein LZ31DRAFT_628187 [Colletotrichum somersetense]